MPAHSPGSKYRLSSSMMALIISSAARPDPPLGHAPVWPEWTSGFWQCKLRYSNQ